MHGSDAAPKLTPYSTHQARGRSFIDSAILRRRSRNGAIQAADAGDGGPPVSLMWRPPAHKLHARKRMTLLAPDSLPQFLEKWK